MRAIPTVTQVGTWGVNNGGTISFSGYRSKMHSTLMLTGTTAGNPTYQHFNSTDDAITFDAEL